MIGFLQTAWVLSLPVSHTIVGGVFVLAKHPSSQQQHLEQQNRLQKVSILPLHLRREIVSSMAKKASSTWLWSTYHLWDMSHHSMQR